jgi:hypothetical protein
MDKTARGTLTDKELINLLRVCVGRVGGSLTDEMAASIIQQIQAVSAIRKTIADEVDDDSEVPVFVLPGLGLILEEETDE